MSDTERTGTTEGTLSAKQAAFLAALLSCGTVEKAATLAGIGRTTAFRWLADPGFAKEYEARKRETIGRACAQLQAICGEAAETLHTVMTGELTPAAVRVTAARSILEYGLRAAELEAVSERLAYLETKIEELSGSTTPTTGGAR